MKQCIKCGTELTDENQYPSYKKHCMYICIKCTQERDKKYRESEKGRLVQKKTDRKYLLTIKGRIIKYKAQAKRRRNLGFIKIHDNIFPKNVHIHWHHIDDERVIALPRDVHRKCYAGQDKERHRILCFQAIKCLYGTSVGDY